MKSLHSRLLPARTGHFYQGCIITACLVTGVIAGSAAQVPFRAGIHNPVTTVMRQVIIAYAVAFTPGISAVDHTGATVIGFFIVAQPATLPPAGTIKHRSPAAVLS